MEDKIRGCLIGSAIGDGFGYPTEFMKLHEIQSEWGSQGLTAPIGDVIKVTDDTQMAIAVSKAIMTSYTDTPIATKLIERETLEKALIHEFVQWLNDKENNRAPGMTCLTSCENLERGMDWVDATARNSKGCGANMRVTPIGLLKCKDPSITDEQIGQWSQLQSAITHAHATALTASELTAITIVKIIEGVKPQQLVDVLIKHCTQQKGMYHHDYLKNVWERPNVYDELEYINRGWDDCIEILQRVKNGVAIGNRDQDPCEVTGEGWIAEEAYGTALLCYLLYPQNSVKALIRAVNTTGDSDSIACLTGAFVGARNGIQSFPQDWIDRIEYKNELNDYISFCLVH